MSSSPLLYTEIKGQPIIGKLVQANPTAIKVRILAPYYGLEVTGKPKMCMLFSENTYSSLGTRALETAYQLAQRLDKRKQEITSDYKELTEKESDIEKNLKEFRQTYLNGFYPTPELLMDPFSDMMEFLGNYYFDKDLEEALVVEPTYTNPKKAQNLLQKILTSFDENEKNKLIKELVSLLE